MSRTFPGELEISPNFVKLEETILADWREHDTFKVTQKRCLDEKRPPFVFYDGPPFATGLPHYGHILAGTIKDVVTRYAVQQGFSVSRRFGWDCHGLPVEFEIDKIEGISSRQQVLDMGIGVYNEKCRSIVQRYAKEWRTSVERLGRWIDFDNDYKTMDLSYMESVWHIFHQLHEKGLVYRAHKVMPYSMACSTPLSNFEAGQAYKDVSDPSIICAFTVKEPEVLGFGDNVALLVWTTTPWTLPSNLALCVKSEMLYVAFKVKASGRVFICAEDRLDWVMKRYKLTAPNDGETENESVKFLARKFSGSKLVGVNYHPLFTQFEASAYWQQRGYKVVADDYVTADAGTGIVHQAPAFGEDDARVCLENNIIEKGGPTLCPLDANCDFNEEAPEWLQGKNVKTTDKEIIQHLMTAGVIDHREQEVHSYPFCWRSDTPLIYRAVGCWFVNVESIKERLVSHNKNINWVPDFVGNARFHNWLDGAKDWCISRNRFWGTPIPIWLSEDEKEMRVFSSVEELQTYKTSGETINDIHRHFIDDIEVPDPRGSEYPPMRRIPEVFDCWFESGSMPYAQVHYPFENKAHFESSFPGDFIAEGLDQTRGWFYTLLVLSTALFDRPPFKNVIVNGLVLAEDGKKMSKSLKNYPDPNTVINEYGADAIRLYLVSSPVVASETLKFSENGVAEMFKGCLLPLYHGFRFFLQEIARSEQLGVAFKYYFHSVRESTNMMDRWVVAELQNLMVNYHVEMRAYRLAKVVPMVVRFLDALTNNYIRFNRDRLKGGSGEDEARLCSQVLFYVLYHITLLLAPFAPYMAEFMYRRLQPGFPKEWKKESTVHMALIPDGDTSLIDQDMIEGAACLRAAIQLVRLMREKKKTSVKQPLKSMTVIQPDAQKARGLRHLAQYIKEELNVMELEITEDKDLVQPVVTLNFKNLGKRLGKAMPSVKKAAGELDACTVEAALKEGNLTIEGFELTGDDFSVSYSPKVTSGEILGEMDRSTNIVVLVDFESNEVIIAAHLSREIVNRVQKLRKELKLSVTDNDVKMYASGCDRVVAVLKSHRDSIQKSLRRDLQMLDDLENEDLVNRIGEQIFEIGFAKLKLVFLR